MQTSASGKPSQGDDHAALRAAAKVGCGLCTIVGIEGSFSRRLGAQLAVEAGGRVIGSLADGCLEAQLAAETARGDGRRVMRFGAGSSLIDFRLPCGSGLDILLDPAPDQAALAGAVARLDAREEALLALPVPAGAGLLEQRAFIPALRLLLLGEGPEMEALALLARAVGVAVEAHNKNSPALALGREPVGLSADRWSAVLLLFHDHEWEQPILGWALRSSAFFIGAQGGRQAREQRLAGLRQAGFNDTVLARIVSPVGVIEHSREPMPLSLSALAQIVGAYERLHPHR